MPLYMDIHSIAGASAEAIARAHRLDLEVQKKYGVDYRRYWLNHQCDKLYCLVDAPSPAAAKAVHAEAHGLLPERIIEVDPEVAEGLLGGVSGIPSGLVTVAGNHSAPETSTRTILFTDIVDSTAMTQRLGDAGAMELVRVHDAIVRNAVRENEGRAVKHTGDGIMAAFTSAAAGVRSAIAVQRSLRDHPVDPCAQPLRVRIGLAAGEPVEERGDLFGTAVQLAARLCSHAEPGQILVANAVVELCDGEGLRFHGERELALKGFTTPMKAHSVEWVSAPASERG